MAGCGSQGGGQGDGSGSTSSRGTNASSYRDFTEDYADYHAPQCADIDNDQLHFILNGHGVVSGMERTGDSCLITLDDSALSVKGSIAVAVSAKWHGAQQIEKQWVAVPWESEDQTSCQTWADEYSDVSYTRCDNGSTGETATEIEVVLDYRNLDPAYLSGRPPESYGRLSVSEHRSVAQSVTNLILPALG